MQDDLIFLPSKVSSSMGHLGPLVLCTRAMNTLHFMEPYTMRSTQVEVSFSSCCFLIDTAKVSVCMPANNCLVVVCRPGCECRPEFSSSMQLDTCCPSVMGSNKQHQRITAQAVQHFLAALWLCPLALHVMQAPVFWRAPYRALLNSRHLTEYMVLDIEPTGQTAANGKLELADAQVARVADFGSNDTTYHVRTHLGHLLNPGDTALGYDLTRANFVDDELEGFLQKGNTLPDVVLVRPHVCYCCCMLSALQPCVSLLLSAM